MEVTFHSVNPILGCDSLKLGRYFQAEFQAIRHIDTVLNSDYWNVLNECPLGLEYWNNENENCKQITGVVLGMEIACEALLPADCVVSIHRLGEEYDEAPDEYAEIQINASWGSLNAGDEN